MFYVSFIIAVLGSLIYHLSIKKIPTGLNPFFSLAAAYVIAFILCLFGMVLWPDGSRQVHQLKFSILGVALGVVGIEIGFLLAYRAGWHVGYAALTVNALSALLLLPVAVLVFKQGITIEKVFGMVLCLSGLFLLLRP